MDFKQRLQAINAKFDAANEAEVVIASKVASAKEVTVWVDKVECTDDKGVITRLSDDIAGKYRDEASVTYIRVGKLEGEVKAEAILTCKAVIGVHVNKAWADIKEAIDTDNEALVDACFDYLDGLVTGKQISELNTVKGIKDAFHPIFVFTSTMVGLCTSNKRNVYFNVANDLFTAIAEGTLTEEQRYAGIMLPALRKAVIEEAGQYGNIFLGDEKLEITIAEGDDAEAIKAITGVNESATTTSATISGLVPTSANNKLVLADLFEILDGSMGKNAVLFGLLPIDENNQYNSDPSTWQEVDEYTISLDDKDIVIGAAELEATLAFKARFGIDHVFVGYKATESSVKELKIGTPGEYVKLSQFWPLPGSVIDLPRTKGVTLRGLLNQSMTAALVASSAASAVKEAALLAASSNNVCPITGEFASHIILAGETELAALTGTGVVATTTKYEAAKAGFSKNKAYWTCATKSANATINAFNGLMPKFTAQFRACSKLIDSAEGQLEVLFPTVYANL